MFLYLEGMLVRLLISHLQIADPIDLHSFPAFLAIAHTSGSDLHSILSYLRNTRATTGAVPKIASRFFRSAETSSAPTALSEIPLYSKPNIWAVSTGSYAHAPVEYSTQGFLQALSALASCKTPFSNILQSLLSISETDILDRILCDTCNRTAYVIVS